MATTQQWDILPNRIGPQFLTESVWREDEVWIINIYVFFSITKFANQAMSLVETVWFTQIIALSAPSVHPRNYIKWYHNDVITKSVILKFWISGDTPSSTQSYLWSQQSLRRLISPNHLSCANVMFNSHRNTWFYSQELCQNWGQKH